MSKIINLNADAELRKYMTEHFNLYEDGVLQSKKSNTPLTSYDIIKIVEHFLEWHKNRVECELKELISGEFCIHPHDSLIAYYISDKRMEDTDDLIEELLNKLDI